MRTPPPSNPPRATTLDPASRWGESSSGTLCLLVLFFVGREAKKLWAADDVSSLSLDIKWLLPAAVCYLIGWLPSVWFWRRMMFELGASPGFSENEPSLLLRTPRQIRSRQGLCRWLFDRRC